MFYQRLKTAVQQQQSCLCVGLDPHPDRYPEGLSGTNAVEEFCIRIVDAVAPYVCAFKPQIAYFHAQRAEQALESICAYIRRHYPEKVLILDAKRNDIGATAQQYASEAFVRYGADAVTVSPYMGLDSLQPFLDYTDKGTIVLCRTSNPGGADLQELEVNGEPLYLHLARMAQQDWNANRNIGLVVGATQPQQLAQVRAVAPDLPLLVPGVGTQGGDPEAVMRAGRGVNGTNLIVNVSRGVLYASAGKDFDVQAAEAARELAAKLTIQE